MESDIKGDKRGLGIEHRRKKSFFAQEALALLAHNLLSWFKGWVLGGTEAEKLGAERLLREVMAMPAEVRMARRGSKLSLKVAQLHPAPPYGRRLVRKSSWGVATSVDLYRFGQRFVARRRARPEPKKLKASPEGEALLTSEGRKARRVLTSGGEAEAC